MTFISYDLGTGGVKASLYNENLQTLAKSFVEYPTRYTGTNFHEQRLEDWWQGVITSTKRLLEKANVDKSTVKSLALSGHSLVAVPLDAENQPLLDYVPIWSDTRAEAEAKRFFETVSYEDWYMKTGNGFPVACYSLFKLMWFAKNQPELYAKTAKVVGSKDYINLKMTGQVAMDYSYASGTGAYDLKARQMCPAYLEAAGLKADIFPNIVKSHAILGNLTAQAAEELGLTTETVVACGGVDNACMALGAVGSADGKIYTSLGSSSWVPINSKEPVLDFDKKPYVFAHIDETMFTSAFSIFAGGSSLKWARDLLFTDIKDEPDVYDTISQLVATSPLGANGVLFNPSLAGGTSQDKSVNIRGGFVNLSLGTAKADVIRAVMEGIALNLKNSVDFLQKQTTTSTEILFCGGGSKSAVWMQIFADVFGMNVIKSNIDQDAASLGAAAIAARAVGTINDYTIIQDLHQVERVSIPNAENHENYQKLLMRFNHVSDLLADLGDYLSQA